MVEVQVSGSRIVAACLVAAAAAPIPISALMAAAMAEAGPAVLALALLTSLVGFVIAAFHLVFALPAYLLCRRRWHLEWWNSAIGGALVGGIPSMLLAGLEGALSALCGVVGGLAFWAVLRGAASKGRLDNLDETFA